MLNSSLPESLVILHEENQLVKTLKDFHSGLRIPKEVNDRTRAFVAKCGHQDISDELDQKFGDFRKHLKLKRLDLKVSDPECGMGMISTPWFDYQVHVTQSEENPSEAVFARQLISIRDTEVLSDSGFLSVFGNQFNCVEYSPPEPIDIESFIDHVEEEDFPGVDLDYDRYGSWCTMTAPGVPGEVKLEDNTIRLTLPQAQPPADLWNAFMTTQSQLGFAIPDVERRTDPDAPD